MMRRKSLNVAATLATLVAPLAALAQGPTGTVTTDPVHQAPALGMPLLLVLVAAMAAVAMYRLRRTVGGPIVGIVLVAAVTVLASVGYATGPIVITISGAGCAQQTTSLFDPLDPTELMSDCVEPIQIIDSETSCGPADSSPNAGPSIRECRVGEILGKGGACRLPSCS